MEKQNYAQPHNTEMELPNTMYNENSVPLEMTQWVTIDTYNKNNEPKNWKYTYKNKEYIFTIRWENIIVDLGKAWRIEGFYLAWMIDPKKINKSIEKKLWLWLHNGHSKRKEDLAELQTEVSLPQLPNFKNTQLYWEWNANNNAIFSKEQPPQNQAIRVELESLFKANFIWGSSIEDLQNYSYNVYIDKSTKKLSYVKLNAWIQTGYYYPDGQWGWQMTSEIVK